jgi:outer membrane lipoprotein SlyB
MSAKSLIWIGVFVGSTVGGFIPMLWGGNMLGVGSIIWGTIGGLAGIWAGFKVSKMI